MGFDVLIDMFRMYELRMNSEERKMGYCRHMLMIENRVGVDFSSMFWMSYGYSRVLLCFTYDKMELGL